MFEQVKQEIDDKIKTNGNNEITATRLNGVLQDMMDATVEELNNYVQKTDPPSPAEGEIVVFDEFGGFGNSGKKVTDFATVAQGAKADTALQPTGVKTINNQSIVGSGNITIEGGGTDDYADLDNKPQINSVTLSGNKSASDLGLATAAQGAKADTGVQSSEKGAINGVATLGSDGKVPQSQLPSYVDDVLEYSNQSSFPATGESGKIYVALDTNKTYRWSGSAYVEISQSLALGETSSTAFPGDRGKAIEDKIPSDASSSNKLVTASNLNGKVDKVVNAQENNFASFDENGGIKDSNCNEGDFATAAQGAKADTAVQQVTVGTTTTGAAGTNASVTNSGTATAPVLDFTIPRGQDGADAVNPFKGWYASANALPANPVVGDYAYVKGANASDPAAIYECTTAGTWSDSGRTADTSNVQTFASGEEVNEVHIVKDLTTGGVNDVLSAEQGKVLEQEISQLDQEVTDLQEDLEGANKDREYTPTATAGYYFSNNNGTLGITSNAGSSHTGTVTSTSTPPTDGVDISAYVGKTLRIYNTGGTTPSSREAVILNASNGVVASVKETAYTQDSDGNWVAEMLIPADGEMFYWSGVRTFVKIVVFNANQTTGLIERVEDLEDALADLHGDVQDLQDAVEGVEGIADELSVVPSISPNLLDPSKLIIGYYRNGQHYGDTNYVESDYIPVTPGLTYKLLNSTTVPHNYYRFVAFFNSQKEWMNGADITSIGTDFTAPVGSAFAKVSLYNDADYLTAYGIFLSSVTDYVPYYYYDVLSVVNDAPFDKKGNNGIVTKKDIPAGLGVTKDLKVVVAYPFATISEGVNNIVVATDYQQARIEDAGQTAYDSNPLFNFYSMLYNGVSQSNSYKDDIAPAHFLGQTLGANHGQPCKKATITGHGLDNTAIGTAWVQNDVNFYVMLIVDENNIVFLSANRGTTTAPQWTALQAGTLTKDADTLTVESVSEYQIHPSIKNENLSIRVDGQAITEDGTYYGNVIDFVESYEVINPSSLLDNIIARAGQAGDPVFTGDAAVRIDNVYRFVKGLNVLVIANFIPKQAMSFQDIMFSQAMLKGTNGTTKYYIPNSLPFDTYDLRQPLAVTWGNSVSPMYCSATYTKDTTKPINRVLQYAGGLGFAIGYIIDRGVGKSLFDFANSTFELRGGSGKVYPHGVEGAKVGTTLQDGQAYNAVLYRAMFIPETSGNRLSMYHFPYDGAEYVFLDYKGSMNDSIVLDDSLNGKAIEVLEAQNATLQTDVYNGGFCVKATFVTNETCYLVAKIK